MRLENFLPHAVAASEATYTHDEASDSGGDEPTSFEDELPTRARTRRNGAARGVPHRGRLHFAVEQLQQFYHLPLKEASQHLGICEAALKRICRRNFIKKWPYRQLQSVTRRLEEEAHMEAMHRAFRHSCMAQDDAAASGFLLPHEVENRRKMNVTLVTQLEREERIRTLRVRELKKERQAIIESAHLAVHPRVPYVDDGDSEDDASFEKPSAIIMVDPIDVEEPLDILATLCASELSRQRRKEHRKPNSALPKDNGVHSVEILSCLMTEVPHDV